MTRILTWNIQNGNGVDGVLSLERIAGVIGEMGSADVICLQEVSRGLVLIDGETAPDQPAELAALFPDHEVVFGIAIDAIDGAGRRWQYGNAVLTRLPLLSTISHLLPRPAESVRHMARQATEVVVASVGGPLRVTCLHLEYHSLAQRFAQVERLRDLQQEAMGHVSRPPLAETGGSYQAVPRPADGVCCGDFNLLPDSDEYRCMLAPLAAGIEPFRDAWTTLYPDRPHDPTCGIFDHAQWPEGRHCRDYFFLSGNCAERARSLAVNLDTDASDHQPLVLELAD